MNTLLKRMLTGCLALVGLFSSATGQAQPAASFPNKTIRIVVPYTPGGNTGVNRSLWTTGLALVAGWVCRPWPRCRPTATPWC